MTGQDAVRSAAGFAARPAADRHHPHQDRRRRARRRGALGRVTSPASPIKFVGVGEKPEDFEPFHPDRMASRILGMGDVLTLIEKVEAQVDETRPAAWRERAASGEFTLEDLRDQLASMKKMGPLVEPDRPAAQGRGVPRARRPDAVDEKPLDARGGDHRLHDPGRAAVPPDPERVAARSASPRGRARPFRKSTASSSSTSRCES